MRRLSNIAPIGPVFIWILALMLSYGTIEAMAIALVSLHQLAIVLTQN